MKINKIVYNYKTCETEIKEIEIDDNIKETPGHHELTLEEPIKEFQMIGQQQDEMLNILLLTIDGMYMMMEPLFLNTITNDNNYYDNIFINMYTVMVQRELKNIEDVPLRYREQVEERLNKN